MARRLRGHHVEVIVPEDPVVLVGQLAELGFEANSFLEQVAKMTIAFVKEEEVRSETTLSTKSNQLNIVVCKQYGDVRGRTSWLHMRKTETHWILSSIMHEQV
jgi:hypothetical protein